MGALEGYHQQDPELALAMEQLAVQRINVFDRQTILEKSFGYIATVPELVKVSDELGCSEGVY